MASRNRTQVVAAPFKSRRNARKLERKVQEWLDAGGNEPLPSNTALGIGQFEASPPIPVPSWAKGVRVEHAGFFQHVVVATEQKGH